jgi:hypothetical protein
MKASILVQGRQRRADAAAQALGAIVEIHLAAQFVGQGQLDDPRAEPAPLGRADGRAAVLGPGDVQRSPSATDQPMSTWPPALDRAPYFRALIASSWKARASTTAGLGETIRSSPLIVSSGLDCCDRA